MRPSSRKADRTPARLTIDYEFVSGSPSRPKVDTSEFFFDGSGLSALLIHGLTGTP